MCEESLQRSHNTSTQMSHNDMFMFKWQNPLMATEIIKEAKDEVQ